MQPNLCKGAGVREGRDPQVSVFAGGNPLQFA
jgi:hypothetical protein